MVYMWVLHRLIGCVEARDLRKGMFARLLSFSGAGVREMGQQGLGVRLQSLGAIYKGGLIQLHHGV